MLIKAGVDISRLNREIRRALGMIVDVVAGIGVELVVTSTYEGTHKGGSLHYGNDAFDFRLPPKWGKFLVDKVKLMLGGDFDVVLEVDHIHVEYDPKMNLRIGGRDLGG
jgi:hypothetical protein